MTGKLKSFIKKEAVFFISLLCAVATMLIVPPDKEYLHYIDLRVLALLFCLMAVVAAFKSIGVFSVLTSKLLSKVKSARVLSLCLIALPFFSSMLVTNDVALIVFVPFTAALLIELGFEKNIVPVLVFQTVAANLGSMATPVGNPQNLYLYSAYNLSAAEFFSAVLPFTAVSLICLSVCSLFLLPKKLPECDIKEEKIKSGKKLLLFIALFVLCLLTVFRVVHFGITTAVVIAVFLILDRKIFKETDFMLLLTFVCFFIISENLGRVEAVREFLQSLLSENALLCAVGTSQVISNVPAAVLLSSFTEDWRSLLEGVNIGGLGTPVASLASLITLKLYLKTKNAKIGKFLIHFTLVNIIGLALLLIFA